MQIEPESVVSSEEKIEEDENTVPDFEDQFVIALIHCFKKLKYRMA